MQDISCVYLSVLVPVPVSALCCATRVPCCATNRGPVPKTGFLAPSTPTPFLPLSRATIAIICTLQVNIQINRMKSTNTSDNADANANVAYSTTFFRTARLEIPARGYAHVVKRRSHALPFPSCSARLRYKSRPCGFSYAWQQQLGTQASIRIVVLQPSKVMYLWHSAFQLLRQHATSI